jgi:hypothetical protein
MNAAARGLTPATVSAKPSRANRASVRDTLLLLCARVPREVELGNSPKIILG